MNHLKFLFTFFLCSGILLSVYSQKVTISPEILLRDDYSFALLGEVDGKVLLIRNKGFRQTLSIYNKGLGFIQEVPLNFEDRKVNEIGFVTNPQDFNFYYSYKSGNNEIVKAVKLSASGEIYYEDTIFIREKVFLPEYYRIAGSEDDRYICIFNIIDDITLQLLFYDNQEMKLIYEKELVVEDVFIRKDFLNIEISNHGEMAILFEKHNSFYKKESHHLRLITFDKNGNENDSKISLKNIISVDQSLVVNNHTNSFEVVGLYSDKYENISHGYFVYKNNKVQINPYDDTLLEGIFQNQKRRTKGLEDYGLNEVIFRQDGGYVLILEANKEYYRNKSSSRMQRTGYNVGITDYYNEDILIMSINPDASFQWNTILPKKQYSQDDDGIYSSYFVFKTPSKLHFIYNDEIKNDNTVSEYVLNPAGVYERNSILSTAYQKLKLRLRSAIQISSSSYVLISEKNSRLNIVKIEI